MAGDAGLTGEQVAARVAAGQTNATALRTSRTLGEIVRANVLTVFNGLLVSLWAVAIATGRWQNSLFGLVVLANAGIGIVQELRAKRTLDRLAVLVAPSARVIREGHPLDVAVAEVVLGDLLVVAAGDQVPADGTVRRSDGLEVDESLLTGEADPVSKAAGDPVRSGSIVVAGGATVLATAVGPDAYAAQLTLEARRYRATHSELVAGTNRLLRWISVVIVVVAPVLVWSQFRSVDNHGWRDAVTSTVAALVGMVPEGLVLLTSLAFMVATLSLGRRSVLVQELPAVETLARVDVVCLDKTGTLTDGDVRFDRLEPCRGFDAPTISAALGLLSRTGRGNATATALAAAFPASDWSREGEVPFSSARKWSSVTVTGRGTWVLGAPELLLTSPAGTAAIEVRRQADVLAAAGSRVLLLATTPPGAVLTADAPLPADLVPAALVLLAEHVRDDAAETLRWFSRQGVALTVLSGDNPRTVGAVSVALDMPGVRTAADVVDARTLPDDADALGHVLARSSVFGRVTPQQKRAVVTELQRQGHVVAMTGDGVNDALALKDADIGIAMGNASPATRAVAQLVLLDGRFAHLPDVVAEGRRVIASIERAATLFLIKNVYSLVLALLVAATGAAYPLAPVQLTLISTVTIGVPAAALALGPDAHRYVPGFLHRVLRFAVPAGVVTAACAYAGYQTTRLLEADAGVAQARTTATLVVLVVSLWTLLVLARPLTRWRLLLVAAMAATVVLVVAVPPLGHGIFLLDESPLRVAVAALIGGGGAVLVELTHRAVVRPTAATAVPSRRG